MIVCAGHDCADAGAGSIQTKRDFAPGACRGGIVYPEASADVLGSSILARATTRIGAVALRSTSVVQIGHARTSDPHDVRLALRVAVESAIGAAEDVAGTPRAVGVRGDAGEGSRSQGGSGQNDRSHQESPGQEGHRPKVL